jgi:hypothetical protein
MRPLGSLTIVLLWLCGPAWAQDQVVRSFPLNGYKRVLDGQWQGIRYASDGNVYFGSSTHSAHHGAAFFKYDPRTGQIVMLAEDLTTICGEDPETNPQGKLHSDIVEANGWLYMSLHFSSELPAAYDRWTGSHVLGYELATGQFRDYGVVHPNYTSYSAIGVDPSRNYVYVFVTGENADQVSYLYRIDTVTGMKTNLGQVGGAWSSSFWTFVDRRGDVWFSVAGQNGALYRVTGATGRIDVFPNALPPMYRWDSEQQVTPAEQVGRRIMWMQPLDADRALFTLGWNGGMLYLFDSTKPIGSGLEFQELKHIGYSDLGLAIGGDRLFYYQRANRGFGQQEARDFHLLSVSLDPATGYAIADHGLLKDQDGRLAWRLPGMATNGRDRLFMIGDWWTIPGDLGTLRYSYSGGVESYVPLPRGEFFAFADISAGDLAGTLSSVTLSSPSVYAGSATTANHVSLTGPAPPGGYVVSLSTSDPLVAAVPDSVTVPEGASTSPPFTITTQNVATNRTVTITARNGDLVRTATLSVTSVKLSSIAIAQSVNAGTPATLNWAALNGPAPSGGVSIMLSSSTPAVATVPNAVFVAAGTHESAFFTIDTFPVTANTSVTITASFGGIARSAILSVRAVVPAPPASLAATSTSTSQINLTWGDVSGETAFSLERCSGAGCTNFVAIASPGANATAFGNTSLSPATHYRYRIKAMNAAGSSLYSNVAEATTRTPPPPAPLSLVATPGSTTEIAIRWTDNSALETGFRVERCTGSGCTAFVAIGQVSANTNTFVNGALSTSTRYRYRVVATNAGGASLPSNVAETVTLPTVPVAFAATPASSTQINLTWTAAPGATGTRVERCSGSGCTNFAQIAQLTAAALANVSLTPATLYRYRVRAYNAGGASAYSPVVEATTPPVIPGGLTVRTISAAEVSVRWSDTVGETGFQLERCAGTGCTNFAVVGQTSANVITFSNGALSSGTRYRYRVRAFNAGGLSGASGIAEALTLPAAPVGLWGTATSSRQIALSWSPVSDAAGVRIERCVGASCTAFATIAQLTSATTYLNTGLVPGTTYVYRLRSYNSAGQSVPSNVASAVTPP